MKEGKQGRRKTRGKHEDTPSFPSVSLYQISLGISIRRTLIGEKEGRREGGKERGKERKRRRVGDKCDAGRNNEGRKKERKKKWKKRRK